MQYGLAKKKPEADQSESQEVKRRSSGSPSIQATVKTQEGGGCLFNDHCRVSLMTNINRIWWPNEIGQNKNKIFKTLKKMYTL